MTDDEQKLTHTINMQWKDAIAKYLPQINFASFMAPDASINWLFDHVMIRPEYLKETQEMLRAKTSEELLAIAFPDMNISDRFRLAGIFPAKEITSRIPSYDPRSYNSALGKEIMKIWVNEDNTMVGFKAENTKLFWFDIEQMPRLMELLTLTFDQGVKADDFYRIELDEKTERMLIFVPRGNGEPL